MPIATPQGTLDFKSVDKVTFVGASSNTVIDTTTGSLGVGVGVGGPTSNLHVVGDTLITGNVSDLNIVSNVNMLHTANTASIKLNSNVVTEFPRSKKLIKYPRVVLNSASQDGYVVTASTDGYVSTKFHRYDPFRPFVSGTGTNSANGWHSGPPDISVANNWDQTFDTSGYNKDLTSYGVGGYAGTSIAGIESEWLKLELPHKIVLSHFYYQQRDGQSINYGQAPRDFRILGSNDDVNWDTIQTFTDQTSLPEGKILTAEASKGYKYLAFVVTKTWVTSGTSHLTLKNLEYYGVPEYDPEAYGTDVVVRSVPNVPNTDWLEVYYDAKGLTPGAVTSVSDLKPSSLGSAINSTSVTDVSVSDGAFVFNGTTSGINATLSNPQGAWIHSVSVWIKLSKDHSEYNDDNVFSIGSAASTAQLESLRINSNDVRFVTFQGGADEIFPLPMNKEQWYHFTLTYDGGASNQSFRLFRNGIESIGTTTTSSVALNVAANSLLSVGYERVRNRSHFSGSIANFRIFNRALTSDEIYQLYAHQKEYFGHGDLSMTLKAGRLGIGTLEPRAALDVQGDIVGSSPVYFYLGISSGHVAATTKIPWNQVRANKGGGYDEGTYNFTAPIGGWYWMAFGGVNRSSSSVLHMSLKDGPNSTDTTLLMAYDRPYGQSLMQASRSGMVYIREGGVVSLWVTSSTVDGGNGLGGASVEWGGFLVSRDFNGKN